MKKDLRRLTRKAAELARRQERLDGETRRTLYQLGQVLPALGHRLVDGRQEGPYVCRRPGCGRGFRHQMHYFRHLRASGHGRGTARRAA